MKQILGFRKTKFGWKWETDIIRKIARRPSWNPLSVLWNREHKELIIRTPGLVSYHFNF